MFKILKRKSDLLRENEEQRLIIKELKSANQEFRYIILVLRSLIDINELLRDESLTLEEREELNNKFNKLKEEINKYTGEKNENKSKYNEASKGSK